MRENNRGESLQKDAAVSLHFEERAFRAEDLRGADFVVAATDDEALNGRIADICKESGFPSMWWMTERDVPFSSRRL